MGSLSDLMAINCEEVCDIIVNFLKRKVEEEKKDGILLGLSGGLDSAVLAVLAAKSIGPPKVYALHLYDRDSEEKFREYAKRIAHKLGINFITRDISELMREKGIYKPLIMKMVSLSSVFNKLLVFTANRVIYPLFFKESPFVLTLNRTKDTLIGTIEEGFNLRHIQRRRILEGYAMEKNLLLVGAVNRSESFLGWFVKGGVDDLPIAPLFGLYKTQIYQLSRFLDVPKEI